MIHVDFVTNFGDYDILFFTDSEKFTDSLPFSFFKKIKQSRVQNNYNLAFQASVI